MSIIFDSVPSDAQLNLQAIEVTKEKLSLGLQKVPQTIGLIGQADAAISTYTPGVPEQVFGASEVAQKYGTGSQIHKMAQTLFLNSGSVIVKAFPLKEDGGDVASAGEYVASGAASEDGAFYLYIAGERVEVIVVDLDDATAIGDAIEAAITANVNLPVTASNAAGTVTITAKWKGITGDDIQLELNRGSDESLPAGVGVAITTMTGGTGNVDIQDALDNVAEGDIYTVFVHPYDDATSLTSLEAFEDVRWDPKVVRGFCAFGSKRGDYATAVTGWTATRNNFSSAIVWQQTIPELQGQVAAAYGGAVARRSGQDPSLQFHSTELKGLTAVPGADQETWTVRDSGVKNGASAIYFVAGVAYIDQAVNTYQTTPTAASAPQVDRFVNTVMVLIAVTYDRQQYFLIQWSQAKLADDGQILPPGQKIMTPNTMKAELLGRYQLYLTEGWVENKDGYAETIIAERDGTNPQRLNSYDQIFIIGNLRVLAMKLAYDFAG